MPVSLRFHPFTPYTHNMSQDPILDTGTQITINEVTYTIRRLGFQDVFKVARILGRGVAILGDDSTQLTGGQVLQVLIASMTSNENEVIDLLASVLNVKRDELLNPDLFPMDSIIDILKALAEHQDLKAFLAKVQGLTETLPEMQQAMQTA